MTGTDITGRRPTRTEATRAAYRHRLAQLMRRTAANLSLPEDGVTAHDIRTDVETRAHDLAAATLRQYRAAITFGVEAGILVEGNADGTPCRWPTGRVRGRRTASLKLKRLTDGDLRRIDRALRGSRSRYARDLRGFLLANRLVGARVCEWRRATFHQCHGETGAPALILPNAKSTNGRATGALRTLHLGGMSDDAVTTIAACARWLSDRERSGTFDAWQAGAAKLLQRVCRRLWPRRRRHVTLYSTRHSFVAAAKTVRGRADVAALLGHRSVETAARHYARTLRGRRPARVYNLPAPSPDNLRYIAADPCAGANGPPAPAAPP